MFATTHPSSRARLDGSTLPLANDARRHARSGLRSRGVGGAFYNGEVSVAHATMVGFTPPDVYVLANIVFANSQVLNQ